MTTTTLLLAFAAAAATVTALPARPHLAATTTTTGAWPAAAADMLEGAMDGEAVLGPAVGFAIRWSALDDGHIRICMKSQLNSSTDWFGLGMSGPTHEKGMGMNHSDIVVAWSNSDNGKPTVQAMYSDAPAGYPGATPKLQITNTSYVYTQGFAVACFTREFASGYNPITDAEGVVIWARGTTVNATHFNYHGADGHDDSGKTQTHRSDETPMIKWK